MRLAVVFIVAVITVLVPAVAMPAPAAVRADSNGQPCFTVDAAAEQRDGTAQFRSVTVTDVALAGAAWEMALPSGRSFALTHSICIPYAGRVTALPQTPAQGAARLYSALLPGGGGAGSTPGRGARRLPRRPGKVGRRGGDPLEWRLPLTNTFSS
jgi:hypothetical protein